jgi:hypothetical protein
MKAVVLLTLFLLFGLAAAAVAQNIERIAEIRVHGNHTTPDADILQIAGLTVGAEIGADALREATERLEQSGRFDSVDVRKRYRSLDDPSDILVIILVDEVTGITEDDLTPGPLKKMRSLGMWLPVLDYDDGYGFTYGARVTFVDVFGKSSRISSPLTWGGEREAAVEVEQTFARGPVTRIAATATINRRENPHFEIGDVRKELRGRVERAFGPWFRIGGGARWTNVDFAGAQTTYVVPYADVLLDTRTDPAFPRNAVHATARLEQLRFDDGVHVTRTMADVRGYVGLYRSAVLALRATVVGAGDPVPPFDQSLLGGAQTLRGFDVGYRVGDNLAAASAEVRVPITSALSMGRFGLKGFVDAGTTYPAGEKLSEQVFDRGVGIGAFTSWAVIRVGLDVAWPLTGPSSKPRWHFGFGVAF